MRQEYGKEGPAAGTVGHAHRSPVTLDEAVDLREPKAAAPVFLFCSKEGIKNEFHEPRWDAFSGIGNVYADIAALGKLVSETVPLHGVEPGGNCEFASIRHCLDGVEAQVEEDLVHLNGYGPDTRFGTGVAHVEGNVGRELRLKRFRAFPYQFRHKRRFGAGIQRFGAVGHADLLHEIFAANSGIKDMQNVLVGCGVQGRSLGPAQLFPV